MRVGDPVKITLTAGEERGKPVAATVVYVHPRRRFYVAEYIVEPGRPVREAFPFPRRNRTGKENAR